MASKINAAWHGRHPMPKNATLDQRIRWHLEHAVECACRDIPGRIVAELRKRGVSVPRRKTRED